MLLLFLLPMVPFAQEKLAIRGVVRNSQGEALSGASVWIEKGSAVTTDEKGSFTLLVLPGTFLLQVSSVGYQPVQIEVHSGYSSLHTITLTKDPEYLQEVRIRQSSAVQQAKKTPYAVEVVDLRSIRERNTDLNRLLDAVPGIRVRESGGMGSEFNYAIHALSGKAVRFFLDGIPMETLGTAFAVNNFPAGALDRIEVYKGVTPVELGGDALGGSINLVTRKDLRNYLDLSYSFGSFNTHRAALNGKWRHDNGFTWLVSASWNRSDNNYKVWGNTVEVADESGRPLPPRKYRRFNDDFSSLAAKLALGVTNKRWADECMLEFSASDLHKGIQTGRTMAFVYGDVRFRENFLMSSLRYAKKDLVVPGLNLSLFAGMNRLEGQTVDTGVSKYNWAGAVIASVTGELEGIRSQKSLYTFTDHHTVGVLNASYALNPHHTLSLNYSANQTHRRGTDVISLANWTIPFREPQQLAKQVAGLSYRWLIPEVRLTNLFFVKHFSYSAQANIYDYNGGAQKELIKHHTSASHWGGGYGATFNWRENRLVKFSAEQTTRMPDAVELLGDGYSILNAPAIKPESSTNMNIGLIQHITRDHHQWTIDAGLFFRNTRNLIWLGEGDLYGTARYENIQKIRSAGLDVSVRYRYKKWLYLTMNGAWMDVRNRQKYTSSGAVNIVYNDRMKNMPSLTANAELRIVCTSLLRDQEDLSFYVGSRYVEGFFLNWPSLGNPATKKRIPEQWVQDAGISYSLREGRCQLSVEGRNLLNRQLYDNYLLQKPGRFLSLSFRCFLRQSIAKQ